MEKKLGIRLIGIIFLFFVNSLVGDTTYVSGVIDTNCVWRPIGSPYVIISDVEINPQVCLTIEPGVQILFTQGTSLIVKGKIRAIGTISDSIIFTTLNPDYRWSRIWFKPEANPCSLKYCRISYASNSGIYNEDTLYIGYSLIINNSGDNGGGIANYGWIMITKNIITNNIVTNKGGGIYNSRERAIISDNLIIDNYAGSGGGIYNYLGTITISNNTVSNNQASDGGGIFNYEGDMMIINTQIVENRAWRGGGIYNEKGYLTITNTTIADNYAEADGGGIYNEGEEEERVIISANRIVGNRASNGGGIFNFQGGITVASNTIITNQAEERGGGIYNEYSERMTTITNNTIVGNQSSFGGGIYNEDGNITIDDNTITNNYAQDYGGGIYNKSEEEQIINIINNTINGNYSENNGGGIYNEQGTITMTNNRITGNQADYGGGIYNEEGTVLATNNSIINNYADDDGGSIYNNGKALITHNLIIDQTVSTIWLDNSLITINYNSLNNLSSDGYIIYNNTADTINARYNYWYTADTAIISQRIYDFFDDSTKGIVFYLPLLYSPITKEKETLAENPKREFKIYPNPATKYFTILLPYHPLWVNVKIYDAMGKIVFAKDFTNQLTNEIKIFFAEKPKSGIYLIKIKANNQEFREKIIFK